MRRMLIYALCALLMCALPAAASSTIHLDALTVEELGVLRRDVDARIRLLQVSDAQGYLGVGDGEDHARRPQAHLGEKVKLEGEILRVQQISQSEGRGFRYYVSLNGSPGRVFQVDYALQAEEGLLLAGDAVTIYGVFTGLAPFDGRGLLMDGAPIVEASAVVPRLAERPSLAADPYAATRSDPAPLGVLARYPGSYHTEYGALELEMTSALRGMAALSFAQDLTKYNVTPLRTQEYLLVWIRVKAVSAPAGRAPISENDFRFVSRTGSEYAPHYLLNSPSALRTLYEGGEQVAILSCLVDKGDRPLIVYQPQSDSPLWFDPCTRHVPDMTGRSFATLELNTSGPEVVQMKRLLAEMGFLSKLETGDKFTSSLKSALAKYQKAMGLPANGVADEATQRLLLSGTYPPDGSREP